MKKIIILFVIFATLAPIHLVYAYANTSSSSKKTARYVNKIKNNPVLLKRFFKEMPKGGDLHNHIGGASFAENMLNYSQGQGLCLDPMTFVVNVNDQCKRENLLDNAKHIPSIQQRIINAWSMNDFTPTSTKSGHDHFFATFGKYHPISSAHEAEMIAEIVDRAGIQNEQYLELMTTTDNNASGALGASIKWDDQNEDWDKLRRLLMDKGLVAIVEKQILIPIANYGAFLQNRLACNTTHPRPGCTVKVRYLYQILREQSPAAVFAQLLAGFEAAKRDPNHIVGINMVQPEDGMIAMRDYKKHMRMVSYLHHLPQYKNIPISLHAGELTQALLPPDQLDGLKFHINDAVYVAGADRIGHGVDIASETNKVALLKKMAKDGIMVEINLTSNDIILNVKKDQHPILLYIKNQVPIALSTDDEGVLRTNLSEQYRIASRDYPLDYEALKNIARNSISYSFLPGKKLWKGSGYDKNQVVQACENDILGSPTPTPACLAFLQKNEKAAWQWELERRFNLFEKKWQ